MSRWQVHNLFSQPLYFFQALICWFVLGFFFFYRYLFFAEPYKGNIFFEHFNALLMYLHFLHAENIIHGKRSYLREKHIGVFMFCITVRSVVLVVSAPFR